MAVIRVEKSKDFTTISNIPLKDKNLSLKAKGLLALVLTLPDDWEYSINGVCKIVKESKAAVMTAFDELEKFGYLKRERNRAKGGKFAGFTYVFYETPQETKSEEEYTDIEEPYSEKPYTENPYTEKPYTENPTQQNTNITKYLNKKTCQQSKDCDAAPADVSCFDENSQEYIIAKTLRDNILELRPKAKVPRNFKDMQKWAELIDKMIRIDKAEPQEIYDLLNFVKHNEFWSRNILSPATLRKHFDRLMITIQNQKPQEKPTPQPQTVSSKADKVLEKLMGEGGLYD